LWELNQPRCVTEARDAAPFFLRSWDRRERINRNRKTPRQQSEPIVNPLSAIVEVALDKRIVAAKPGAANASRYAVVNAGGGARNEL